MAKTRRGYFASVSVLALVTAFLASPPEQARAANYTASNETELRNAITAANNDPDASATITLTSSFSVSNTALPAPTKPLTIDTGGFTLSSAYNAATVGSVGTLMLTGPFSGGALTLSGTVLGADAGPADTTEGGTGLRLIGQASVITHGSVVGGAGGGAGGGGGYGAKLNGQSTLTNTGTITGGASGSGAGGVGVQVVQGSSLVNNGTIQGGNSQSGAGGLGVFLGSPSGGPSTLVNHGTIRGGSGGVGNGGTALHLRAGAGAIVNTGTIEGGSNATAIEAFSTNLGITLTNSGIIRAGAGQADAIRLGAGSTAAITLELQAGSVIEGNVIGGALSANDIFRLGGAANATFEVSAIGDTAQYRNFNIFEKTGTSTWTLIGTGTTVTPWVIQQGTLQLGNGGTSGSIIGDVTNNGTLAFNRSDAMAYSGVISGSGAIRQIGSGLVNLTGDSSAFAGTTSVEAGTLAVNGSLGSSVTVAGGVLGGAGTVGGIVAQSGGTVAPGNSIGTLNVAGNVSFAAGSFYQVEVNDAGQSDRINATGAGTLSGGTVQVLAETGTYQPSTTYTILTANGGVSGTFAGVTSNFAFLDPALRYDANNVFLTLARKTDPVDPVDPVDPTDPVDPPDPTDPVDPPPLAFHSVAQTKNQYRTADAVEALGTGGRLFDAVIGQSVAGARQAFDALSGEAHASAASVAYEDGRLVREAILTRLRRPLNPSLPTFAQGSYSAAYAADLPGAAPGPDPVTPGFDPRRFALWGEGFGSWGKVDGNGNAASLDTSTGGFILGADALVSEAVRLGVAGGFTRTTFDVDGRLSSGSNDSVFGALYGASSWGALSLRLGASYAWHDFDVSRAIRFPGFADSTHASYDGWTAQAFAEVGYRFDLGRVTLEPFAGASVLRLHTDGFVEEGGAAALTGYAQNQDLATTTLGLRAEARLSEDLPLTLRGLLGWRHAFGDVEPQALLAFAGGASAFTVAGVPIDRDALVAEAGLDWQASDALSLGVSYSGQIGERAQDHALKGNLTWRFSTQ